jgi:tetratricopeptide (TPR) repeat protein
MKGASWMLVVLMAVAGASEARAQVFFSNTVAIGPFAGSRSFSVVRFGPRRSYAGFYYRWYFPSYYSYPYWGDPYLGSGIYYSNPAVVIVPPPAPAPPAPRQQEGEEPKGRLIILPRKGEAAEEAKPLPGKEAGVFRPLQPEDRARALQPPPAEIPKPPEAAPPAPEPPKETPPVPVDLVSRGKQAFASQEYGRAERLFRKLIEKEPRNPLGYFLLAQAQFALAKYEEATQSIHAGLKLQPDWPKSEFRAELLYGPHRPDFQEQLDHIRELVNRNPSDPVLLFLFAYQLWFTGRPEEAKPVFQRAKDIASDKIEIDLFLRPR